MKKMFSILVLVFMALLLVACNKDDGIEEIKLNEKDKVELTLEQALKKVQNFEIGLTDTAKIAVNIENFLVDVENGFERTETNVDGHNSNYGNNSSVYYQGSGTALAYLDKNSDLQMNIDAKFTGKSEYNYFNNDLEENISNSEVEFDGKTNLYYKDQDEMLYLDIDASFKNDGTTATLEGKYKQEGTIGEDFQQIVDGFKVSDFLTNALIDELLLTEGFTDLINEAGKLEFYDNKDYFAIKITMSKELGNAFTLFIGADDEIINELNFELIIKFVDNKLNAISGSIKADLEIDEDTTQNHSDEYWTETTNQYTKGIIKIEASFSITMGEKMPSFPNFNGYTTKDFNDIFNF